MAKDYRPVRINGKKLTRYKVHSSGKIEKRAKYCTEDFCWEEVKPFEHQSSDYLRIRIEGRSFFLHRIICSSWHKKPKGKDYVHHKNHDKRSNFKDNLCWISASENMLEYHKHKRAAAKCNKNSGSKE